VCAVGGGLLLLGQSARGQLDQQLPPEWKVQQNRDKLEEASKQEVSARPTKVPKEVKVTVDVGRIRNYMAPWAMAVQSVVSDNHLMDPEVPALLRVVGLTTVRYPGGGKADQYHWSTYKASNWQGTGGSNVYYAPGNNFGGFVSLINQFGTTIVTVNYGSNLDGTGGGEPAEAAAWVAYANGNPADTKVIGKDSTGHDWQTVGYWASLRASAPLPDDDGKNFLRIQRPAPLGIRFWEVGNEVYKNGYYGGQGDEEDAHAAYPQNVKDNERLRNKHASLGPEAYGRALVQFAQAMKAVDPRISVGASLDLPLAGNMTREWKQDPVTGKWEEQAASADKAFSRGLDWDKVVLTAACSDIDFVSLHWYPGGTTEASNWKDLDNFKLLAAPTDELRPIIAGLAEQFQKYCGQHAQRMRFVVTELAPLPYAKVTDELVPGLFAADVYPSLMETGALNIDWVELHNPAFLNEQNKPGPVYFGMQMVHLLLNYNDALLVAGSSSTLLSVHAAKRADGSLGLMLMNKDPKNSTTVKVTVAGASLGVKGTRFDYGKTNPPDGNAIRGKPIEAVGNSFSVTMPPYTVTDIVIPKSQ